MISDWCEEENGNWPWPNFHFPVSSFGLLKSAIESGGR